MLVGQPGGTAHQVCASACDPQEPVACPGPDVAVVVLQERFDDACAGHGHLLECAALRPPGDAPAGADPKGPLPIHQDGQHVIGGETVARRVGRRDARALEACKAAVRGHPEPPGGVRSEGVVAIPRQALLCPQSRDPLPLDAPDALRRQRPHAAIRVLHDRSHGGRPQALDLLEGSTSTRVAHHEAAKGPDPESSVARLMHREDVLAEQTGRGQPVVDRKADAVEAHEPVGRGKPEIARARREDRAHPRAGKPLALSPGAEGVLVGRTVRIERYGRRRRASGREDRETCRDPARHAGFSASSGEAAGRFGVARPSGAPRSPARPRSYTR